MSRNDAKLFSPSPSNTTDGMSAGASARREASQNTSLAPLSRITKFDNATGNLKLTGTTISPARMMPSNAATYSARFADRMAMRSPVLKPMRLNARATPLARASSSPYVTRVSSHAPFPWAGSPSAISASLSGSALAPIRSPRFWGIAIVYYSDKFDHGIEFFKQHDQRRRAGVRMDGVGEAREACAGGKRGEPLMLCVQITYLDDDCAKEA